MEKLIRQISIRGLEILGRYYGTYAGIVIDNDDPDNLNRLKVIIPQITGIKTHPEWVIPNQGFAGKDYGVNIPVKVGDTVWVSFKFGDKRKPLWSHGFYAPGEKPEEFDNNTYGLKTPNKNVVLLDDSANSIKILLGEKYELLLDKENELLRITNDDFIWEVDVSNKLRVKNSDTDLKEEMDKLLDGINAITVTTAMGPSSTPVNAATFTAIKTALGKLLR